MLYWPGPGSNGRVALVPNVWCFGSTYSCPNLLAIAMAALGYSRDSRPSKKADDFKNKTTQQEKKKEENQENKIKNYLKTVRKNKKCENVKKSVLCHLWFREMNRRFRVMKL